MRTFLVSTWPSSPASSASSVPRSTTLHLTPSGELGPAAEAYLQSVAIVACFAGYFGRGVLLRIAKHLLGCALVRGRGNVFPIYHKSIVKRAGKEFRDRAVAAFE